MNRLRTLLFVIAVVAPAVLPGCGAGVGYKDAIVSGDTVNLTIGGKATTVELALDEEYRKKGLMFRESMPADHGMLFAYGKPDTRSFWMKNTPIPLSIAFISEVGEILQIEEMKPHDERGTLSKAKVRYALEMNQGWFERSGVEIGSRIANFEAVFANLPVR